MDRKYLAFLDIDGVFTSNRVHLAHDAEYKMWHRFDPVAIDFMNWIHDTYPIEFVIMSTWKNHITKNNDIHTEHWVRAAFANSGFRGMIASPWKTDPDNFAVMKNWDRGHEVKDYLENFGPNVEDFILFDDNQYRFKEILGKQRLVRTDHENGMLFKHMLNAKSIMGNWVKKK